MPVQQWIRTKLRRLVPVVATLALLGGGAVALDVVATTTAYADTLGYPWPTDSQAPCEFGSAGGTSCVNPNNPADEYDWGVYVNGVFQPYRNGYEYRNCTDYVQWKESTIGVSVPSNWGNGGSWYDSAPAAERSTTPLAWDAAVKPGNPGHVAFVESVNSDGTITVSEYNHNEDGTGDTRTGTASSMGFTEFVNFGVHPSGGGSGSGPTPGPFYQFTNSGSGWTLSDDTYTNSGGTTWNVQGSPSVIWGSTINVFVVGMNGQLLQYTLPPGASQWFPDTIPSSNLTFVVQLLFHVE